ncbi:uncharacterized protein [Amphiura filiformis]|uniref:uncharacterized protein n=1 Tax=Amphiura filiformis TaxID=82378 RepID=UPI003B222755
MLPILSFQNEYKTSTRNWPSTYWLVLKVLCLFHGRQIVTKQVCHYCHLRKLQTERRDAGNTGPLPNYLFPAALGSTTGLLHDDDDNRLKDGNVNEIPEDERVENCEVCDSMWWDADGKPDRYKEENIGVGWWNHRGSMYLSFFILLTSIAFLLYDAMAHIIERWGDQKQLMRLLSYFSFLFNISAVPVICLVANLRNILPRSRISTFAWTSALHPRYIVKRLQYLRPETSTAIKKPFLFACIIWPLFNSVYRACIYFLLVRSYDLHIHITLITNGIVTELWGCFCYLLIILRISIHIQLKHDITFLRKHLGKVDICRKRLGASIDEYGSLCNLCAIWMMLTISMASLGIATHTSWNYLLYSGKIPMNQTKLHINIMIWSEILMVLVLPLMAVGGLDLHWIWEDFLTRICEIRCDKHHCFWEKIVKFIKHEFNPVTNVVQLTLLFSVISYYMALKVEDQDANYWGNQRNATRLIEPM